MKKMIMKNKKILFILGLLLVILALVFFVIDFSEEEEVETAEVERMQLSPFKGFYSGTFISETDGGELDIEVLFNGSIEGGGESSRIEREMRERGAPEGFSMAEFQLRGDVSPDGTFEAEAISVETHEYMFYFRGNFFEEDGSYIGEGTWESAHDFDGIWMVEKEE